MEQDALSSILIVDDDATDLDALNKILKQQYAIYFAKSGKSALKRALENKPDLILLDILMPDMSGYDVLADLKKNSATRNTPVIFITGLSSVHNEEKGFQLGAVDYITKPFHSAIVKARIQSHLSTAQQIREKDTASIMLKTRQELRSIFFREIVYLEVSGHWVYFHLADGERVAVYASLKEYEDTFLADLRFAHTHKSFIANMDYVEVVEVRDILMKNGDRLPISKGYANFKKRYVEWVTE